VGLRLGFGGWIVGGDGLVLGLHGGWIMGGDVVGATFTTIHDVFYQSLKCGTIEYHMTLNPMVCTIIIFIRPMGFNGIWMIWFYRW